MSNIDDWRRANGQFLADSLKSLRSALRALAARNHSGQADESQVVGVLPGQVVPSGLVSPSSPGGDASLAEPDSIFQTDGRYGSEPPALMVLAERFGLTAFERNTLLLCAANELDTGIRGLCALAQDDPNRPFPTFALALTLFEDPAWDALSPERPLRYWRLIEVSQTATQPLTTSPLRIDERILNFVKGLNLLDDRLSPLVSVITDDPLTARPPASQEAQANAIARAVEQSVLDRSLPLVQLLGSDSASKHMVALAATRALGMNLYRLWSGGIPTPSEVDGFARLWERETLLSTIALYVDVMDCAREDSTALIGRLLERCGGLIFLDSRDAWPQVERGTLSFDVSKPTRREQLALWDSSLRGLAGDAPAMLAGEFNFDARTIQHVAADVQRSLDDHGLPLIKPWQSAISHARPALDLLAERLDPKVRWDDIKLLKSEMSLLRQIADQARLRSAVYDDWGFRDVMSRGLGITALFAGPSGSGKTMAAEVLANELDLLLYRIDLSSVVSKYIGETAKNLRKLFDAAEHGGVLLFFDEADALFGKRSEVKHSNDRYANIEVNYLLQRLETFEGVAILATNMKSALDDAFVRRLRFIVDFKFPVASERRAIWQTAFPPLVPIERLDYDKLSKLNITGGNIRNISLNAAFLASAANTPVTMRLVLQAARDEFRKLEKPINEPAFRWLEPVEERAQ